MTTSAEPSISSEPVDVSATPHSLAQAVHARRSEYVKKHRTRVKIGAWNVAACPGTDKDLASWFVGGEGVDKDLAALDLSDNPAVEQTNLGAGEGETGSVRLVGGSEVGLYVLGLQEIVDLNMTKEYMNRAVYTDTGPIVKWKAALEAAMPPGYQLVMAEQMTGLLLLIYACPEIVPTISSVSTKQVGTGLLGYFGNKGAVTARLVLGETTRMVFVNCHLASGAGQSYLERRCWDVSQILAKTQFDPIVSSGVSDDEGERIGDEDFAFWFGDLNFRLDGLPGGDIRRILTLHTRGEYDLNQKKSSAALDGEDPVVVRASESDDDTTTVSSLQSPEHSFDSESSLPDPDEFPEDPGQDPVSLQATLDSLLPHDQLKRTIAQRKAFHDGWREGPISFAPTYKYDVGTVGLFDSSEKQRAPSWCDRILFRTRSDKQGYEQKIIEEVKSKKRDEEMKSRGIDQDDDVLFSYDPDTDGEEQPKGTAGVDYDEYDENEDPGPQETVTKAGFHDHINLDIYTSHQRIMSSDHKPIVSVFTLDYDAVVPELKAKVHAEVARELDRAENEGRPGITVIAEGSKDQGESAVDFGDLGFMERKSCSVTIANTGGVAAKISFVDKPNTEEEGESPVPQWLTTSLVRPDGDAEPDADPLGKFVTLEPGETALALIEAQISAISQLQGLNDARTSIEEVLVLRVEDGRDHFISARGSWQPSCFGRSIEELVRVPDGGIRKFCRESNITGSIPYDMDVQCSAPKEIFKLTEAVQTTAERCVADEAMLESMTLPRDPGWPVDASTWTAAAPNLEELKAALIAALDTDMSVLEALPVELPSSHKLEVLCSVLLLFLASLTDGLIPPQVWSKLPTALPNLATLPASAWPDAKTQILDILSAAPTHSIAFVFLTSTLSRVASELSPAAAPTSLRGGLGRRLSFRKGDEDGSKKRRTKERRFAEVVAPLVCRGVDSDKATRERQRVVLEIFVKRE